MAVTVSTCTDYVTPKRTRQTGHEETEEKHENLDSNHVLCDEIQTTWLTNFQGIIPGSTVAQQLQLELVSIRPEIVKNYVCDN
jgi:hypothetical protein